MRTYAMGWRVLAVAIGTTSGLMATHCGQAIPLTHDASLGGAVLANGTTRSGSVGKIYTVTQVVAATAGNPFTLDSDMPFTVSGSGSCGAPLNVQTMPFFTTGGTLTHDCQTAFHFDYTYPPNNYKLAEAHLVMDILRDPTETEGVFLDGVFSGRPPSVNLTTFTPPTVTTPSTKITYPLFVGNLGGYTANTTFTDWQQAHYKVNVENSMDFNIDSLLTTTPTLPVATLDLVKDGRLNAVVGDDSTLYANTVFLVMKGYTISSTPLTCTSTPTYNFTNVYVHNDGNSIGQSAFSGTVYNPYTSCKPYCGAGNTTCATGTGINTANTNTCGAGSAPTSFHSEEWYYDVALPNVDVANITITSATITNPTTSNAASAPLPSSPNLYVRKDTSAYATSAIVVNGIGAYETGFDQTQATSVVESWDTTASGVWSTKVASIANQTTVPYSIDLIAMYGADKVKTLIAQGKLNVAVAGSMAFMQGTDLTSTRYFNSHGLSGSGALQFQVQGPELTISGTYYNTTCTVPNDSTSPLSDSTSSASLNSTVAPTIFSVTVSQITSSSATISWLTDQPSSSQVFYGIGNTNTHSALDSTQVTFHSVTVTGLSAYKVYSVQASSTNSSSANSVSGATAFQTLR